MDTQIQKANQTISLSDKQVTIACYVAEVNMIVPYPLKDDQIEHWARSIDRLLPDLNLEELGRVLDDFKMDVLVWDNSKGIQNLFNALIPKTYSPDITN